MRAPSSPRRIAILLSAALAAACGSERKAAAPPGGGDADEARYVAAARPFLQALVDQDHAKAYGLTSSHLRASVSLDAFTQKNRDAYASLGTPIRLGDSSAETDPAVLVGSAHATGDDELEKAANRLLADVAVGDMPDTIPAAIRKASVTANVVYGKGEDGEDPFYILTAVLVEDAGQLRVGHYFFRAATMLDD